MTVPIKVNDDRLILFNYIISTIDGINNRMIIDSIRKVIYLHSYCIPNEILHIALLMKEDSINHD